MALFLGAGPAVDEELRAWMTLTRRSGRFRRGSDTRWEVEGKVGGWLWPEGHSRGEAQHL